MYTNNYNLVKKMLLRVTLAVFVVEILVMLALPYLPLVPGSAVFVLLDAAVVAAVCATAIWHLIAKPLSLESGASAEKFTRLLEAVPEGVLGVDAGGRIRFVNTQAETLFRYDEAALIGKPVEALIPADHTEHHRRMRDAYLGAPSLRKMGAGLDLQALRSDGTRFPVDISLNHVETPEGRLVICMVRDVTEQRRANDALRDANRELKSSVHALEHRTDELRRVSELAELLQGSITEEEASSIIARVVGRQLPQTSGGIYLTAASRDHLRLGPSWGAQAPTLPPQFVPEDCWALRRGRMHLSQDVQSTIQCQHINPQHQGSLCVPMLAQGDLMGVFHIFVPLQNAESGTDPLQNLLEEERVLLIAMAEQMGLALANLRLRQELRNQSIRDPLTGLYNRRYMEEALAREVRLAANSGTPLSVAAVDLDHFKQFNDTFGHEGGDVVLREVGALLIRQCTEDDLAVRLGGEELLLVYPRLGIEDAAGRAESVRREIEELAVFLNKKPLGKVTVSIGIAGFPEHGGDPKQLLSAADLALYEAKDRGRNRVVVAAGDEPRKPLRRIGA